MRGLNTYFQFNLAAQGITLDRDVPLAFRDMRALGTLRQSTDALTLAPIVSDHATSPAYQVADGRAQTIAGVDPARIADAVLNVNTLTHLALGATPALTTPGIEAENAQNIDHTRQALGQLQVLAKMPGAEAMERVFGLGRAESFQKMMESKAGLDLVTTAGRGAMIADRQPASQYAALKFILANKMLADPLEQRIAQDFVTAFERRAPEIAAAPATLKIEKSFDAGVIGNYVMQPASTPPVPAPRQTAPGAAP